ncbi:MAG: hypothetical protein IT305_14360 [Chloroflexi bacterium]|nr:hypothetical protein [Chloroflexota bacterium]
MNLDTIGVPLFVAIATVVVLGYVLGSFATRRRAAQSIRWVSRGLDEWREDGARSAALKWRAGTAFTFVLEDARSPFGRIFVTVLLRSRAPLAFWLFDLALGQRDLLLLRCDLRWQPIWGMEVFRPGSLLDADVRRLALVERWPVEPLAPGRLLVAHGGGRAAELCHRLLDALGEHRRRLVRLGIRRRAPHLTLAIDLPDPERSDPRAPFLLAERLATIVRDYSTLRVEQP